MKQRKNHGSRFIGYDNSAPTAWYTLLGLLVVFITFFHFTILPTLEIGTTHVHAESQEVFEARLKEREAGARKEAHRQLFLQELYHCESTGNDHAVGDGGDSIGGYQVQETTLEDWLGRKVSYDEYYSIVTDYERIHPLVYEAYFERGESWRWKVCTKKLMAKQSWEF